MGSCRDLESGVYPAVNLAMQWTPRVMMYAKASKAYKAGGSAEGGPDFRATYDPEEVTSYELGLKSQLFGRMLTLNTAAFRNEFDGLQVDLSTDPVDYREGTDPLHVRKLTDYTLSFYAARSYLESHAEPKVLDGAWEDPAGLDSLLVFPGDRDALRRGVVLKVGP